MPIANGVYRTEKSDMTKTLHRLDLLKEFPKYDYGAPRQAWLVDYRRADNNTAAQIMSFHYYWATKMCGDSGHIGISLLMSNLPYCLSVAPESGSGVHIVSPVENLAAILQPASVSLIIISSAVSLLACQSLPKDALPEIRKRRFCTGKETLPMLREWASLLMPGGAMVANLIDESIAREAGWSLFQKDNRLQHAWTPKRFEEHIVKPMSDLFELDEINSMGNHFSFQVVLKKK